IPKHLLEKQYADDKMNIGHVPYWNEEFIGTGPYVAKQFTRGSGMLLQANDRYVMGRPRIDELEVKFIPSPPTLAANLLASAVDMPLGRNLSLDQALGVRDQWKAGRVVPSDPSGIIMIYPQFINPSPAAVANVEFRRALTHALDRQEMVDELQAGLAIVSHSIWPPGTPEYQAVQSSFFRCDDDP